MFDYIFILYSCKKNIEKTKKLYDKIHDKLYNTKVYIIYGDDSMNENYKIIDDKYIILKVKDDYDHLCDKTLILVKVINLIYPKIKGMFKCDDDIIVNLNHVNTVIKIIKNENIDYFGRYIVRTKEYNKWRTENGHDKYPTYECKYSAGPLYFLSKKSMNYFNDDKEIQIIYYEDMMIGYHLNKFNIYPSDKINLYSDNIHDSNKISYHNSKHYEEIYIIIQGGLGNQLFQIASALRLAEKYNKKFTLNISLINPSNHQNYDIVTTINTLHQLFPDISICNTQINTHLEYYYYKENKNECFEFTDKKIDAYFNIYNNIVLDGYFINYKYIQQSVFDKITVLPRDISLLSFDFTNVYFIHIRLGDYLKINMYQLNLKSYYNYCIEQILNVNKDAKFIICTNQYDIELNYYLKDFPKNMKYIIQNKENNDIDTLYIMSSCCGAICSNSTLSFMGTVLQKNIKNKEHIYMPYPFVNFTDGFNEHNVTKEMYPEWCSVYDTLNNSMI